MQFKSIVGHKKLQKHLIQTYQAGRTAHAQIFLGAEGCGKLALAIAYAQYLLCEAPTEEDSCGVCNACRKVQKLIHPDLHFSYPVVGTGNTSATFIKKWRELLLETSYPSMQEWLTKLEAEQKKGNISKNECVAIIQKFSLKSVEGAYKILILWMPEFLGKEGNRLLKLIEEPRPRTVFILVAERQDKILNTILSRCQLLRISRLDSQELKDYLSTHYAITPDKAESVAYLAEGNIHKARQWIAESTTKDYNQLFVDWLRLCFKGNGRDLVDWVEGVCSGKDLDRRTRAKLNRNDQHLFFQYGLYFLREFTRLKIQGSSTKIRLKAKIREVAQKLTSVLSLSQVGALRTRFDEATYHLERNVNSKILLLDVSIEVHKILRSKQ